MFASGKTSAASTGGYQISRSLRFNSADSTYLNRTPASVGNQKTWTYSTWVKRTSNFIDGATSHHLIRVDSNETTIRFDAGTNTNSLRLYALSGTLDLVTSALYRDYSAWYHIVVAVDTTQATSSNRAKVYVNGVQITQFHTANYPSQNADTGMNNTVAHAIGSSAAATEFFNGYQTECYFIDGQALTPSSFGETNAQTGVWQPKAYSGSYGTNGFYLNFSDNSNTTAATLGKDYSGNGNNWTPNNFSVTAGAGNDSLVDSPTSYGVDTGVGGTVRGNYCTFNPNLYNAGSVSYSNGNLLMTMSAGADRFNLGTIGALTGKYYWELTLANINSSGDVGVGICKVSRGANGPWVANGGPDTIYFNTSSGWNVYGTNVGGGTGTISNDVLGIALDMDGNNLYIYKNNVLLASRSGSIDLTVAHTLFIDTYATNSNATLNAGQRPFAYTAPSGFKALCTQNLPTPTIGATTATQAGKYFNPVLYTGNGTTQSITGVGFQPDWVWIKSRNNGSTNHSLYDVIRGAGKVLFTNGTEPEYTVNDLTSFNSDGFSVSTVGATRIETNASGYTYVGWNWKANGSGSTNTSGSITSTVSANTTSGFSIVTFTGTGANATVGHGLGVAPSMLIEKNRVSGTALWFVYHRVLGATKFLRLNADNAEATNSGVWNDTAPTSSVISIGSNSDINGSGQGGVFYCFAEVAGYSKFGSYTGNGSADGPFVFTGMRPAYVMIKRTNDSGNWQIFDDTRSPINAVSNLLQAQSSAAESSDSNRILDFVSNGFKLRVGAPVTGDINASGSTYIYACFAENPFKYSLAR
jgi:hypothetical protein